MGDLGTRRGRVRVMHTVSRALFGGDQELLIKKTLCDKYPFCRSRLHLLQRILHSEVWLGLRARLDCSSKGNALNALYCICIRRNSRVKGMLTKRVREEGKNRKKEEIDWGKKQVEQEHCCANVMECINERQMHCTARCCFCIHSFIHSFIQGFI